MTSRCSLSLYIIDAINNLFFCVVSRQWTYIHFLLTITTFNTINTVCISQSMLIRYGYGLLDVTYWTCYQRDECMGVNKIGLIKNQMREKKKSIIRVIFASLMGVVLYRFCFSLFFTPIMLCSLLYSTTMTS